MFISSWTIYVSFLQYILFYKFEKEAVSSSLYDELKQIVKCRNQSDLTGFNDRMFDTKDSMIKIKTL